MCFARARIEDENEQYNWDGGERYKMRTAEGIKTCEERVTRLAISLSDGREKIKIRGITREDSSDAPHIEECVMIVCEKVQDADQEGVVVVGQLYRRLCMGYSAFDGACCFKGWLGDSGRFSICCNAVYAPSSVCSQVERALAQYRQCCGHEDMMVVGRPDSGPIKYAPKLAIFRAVWHTTFRAPKIRIIHRLAAWSGANTRRKRQASFKRGCGAFVTAMLPCHSSK